MNLTLSLTLSLSAFDDGQFLTCKASHARFGEDPLLG
jgi:hypothetical protein